MASNEWTNIVLHSNLNQIICYFPWILNIVNWSTPPQHSQLVLPALLATLWIGIPSTDDIHIPNILYLDDEKTPNRAKLPKYWHTNDTSVPYSFFIHRTPFEPSFARQYSIGRSNPTEYCIVFMHGGRIGKLKRIYLIDFDDIKTDNFSYFNTSSWTHLFLLILSFAIEIKIKKKN